MTPTPTPTSGAADLRTAAQAVVDRWDTPLWKDVPATAEYIGRLRAALAAGQATAAQPVAEPADTVVLNAAMRAIQQAVELIGAPTDERMRAVRRVLRGAVIVAEDDGKVAPLPSTAYAALPEYGINTASHAHFRVLGFTADQMRAFADATHALRASHGQAPAGAGMGHTDGGRNMFYEGRFDGESQREQQARLRWANDMRAAFERHTGNGWFDKDWRTETGLWSSAWHACLAAQPTTTAQAVVQDDLITIRKPTTSAEMLWLLKLAHLVISDVDKTLEAAFAPAQPAVEASRFGSPELQAMIIARCVEKDQADSVQEDAARLDWLEQNLFHRVMDEWDVKFGGRGDQNMWVLFAPKGVQGSARRIIDAARKQGANHD